MHILSSTGRSHQRLYTGVIYDSWSRLYGADNGLDIDTDNETSDSNTPHTQRPAARDHAIYCVRVIPGMSQHVSCSATSPYSTRELRNPDTRSQHEILRPSQSDHMRIHPRGLVSIDRALLRVVIPPFHHCVFICIARALRARSSVDQIFP